jgi:hypothetical protein
MFDPANGGLSSVFAQPVAFHRHCLINAALLACFRTHLA